MVLVLILYSLCQPFQIITTMSGLGKGGKVKGKAKSRSSSIFQFPVGSIRRLVTAFFVQGHLYIWSCSGRETVTSVWALELWSTWPLSWSISPPGSSSWLATPPGTKRRRGYFSGTCSQLSGTGVARSILALTLMIVQER